MLPTDCTMSNADALKDVLHASGADYDLAAECFGLPCPRLPFADDYCPEEVCAQTPSADSPMSSLPHLRGPMFPELFPACTSLTSCDFRSACVYFSQPIELFLNVPRPACQKPANYCLRASYLQKGQVADDSVRLSHTHSRALLYRMRRA